MNKKGLAWYEKRVFPVSLIGIDIPAKWSTELVSSPRGNSSLREKPIDKTNKFPPIHSRNSSDVPELRKKELSLESPKHQKHLFYKPRVIRMGARSSIVLYSPLPFPTNIEKKQRAIGKKKPKANVYFEKQSQLFKNNFERLRVLMEDPLVYD